MENVTLVKGLKHIALSGCLLVFCTSALALEADTVERWIGSVEAIKAWSAEADEDIYWEIRTLNEPRDIDFDRIWSEHFMARPAVADIRHEHGLGDDAKWNRISGDMLQAWLSLQMSEIIIPKAEKEMAENRAMIEDHPDVSEQQKREWFEQMDQKLDQLRGFAQRAPEVDVELLRPHLDRLNALFGE